MGDLIYRLLLFIDTCRENTLNYTIAITILQNLKSVPNMSVNKLSDLCYTSPAAISRFCKKLGYSGFPDFKNHLEISISNHNNGFLKPKGLNHNHNRNDILNIMHDEIDSELELAKESLDLKIVDRVIDLIYSNSNICCFGTLFSQLIAQDMQLKFANVGKIINVASDVQTQEILAESLDKNSLAILISPTGRFKSHHENLWNKIKDGNATLVVVTEDRDNPYKNFSDYTIYLPQSKKEYLYSYKNKYSLTFLMDYIFVRYCSLFLS